MHLNSNSKPQYSKGYLILLSGTCKVWASLAVFDYQFYTSISLRSKDPIFITVDGFFLKTIQNFSIVET